MASTVKFSLRRVYGFVILALLLMAGSGPWGFDLINVPAQYSCDAPFFRLKGDFCGEPVSAVRGLSVLVGDLNDHDTVIEFAEGWADIRK